MTSNEICPHHLIGTCQTNCPLKHPLIPEIAQLIHYQIHDTELERWSINDLASFQLPTRKKITPCCTYYLHSRCAFKNRCRNLHPTVSEMAQRIIHQLLHKNRMDLARKTVPEIIVGSQTAKRNKRRNVVKSFIYPPGNHP